jgi:hypothetical protein
VIRRLCPPDDVEGLIELTRGRQTLAVGRHDLAVVGEGERAAFQYRNRLAYPLLAHQHRGVVEDRLAILPIGLVALSPIGVRRLEVGAVYRHGIGDHEVR